MTLILFVVGLVSGIILAKAATMFPWAKRDPATLKKEEKQDDELQDSEGGKEQDSEGEEEESEEDEENVQERLKLVLVVRQDLKMTTGKMCSQCSHATLGIYQDILRRNRKNRDAKATKLHAQWLKEWGNSGCAKIVLKAQDEQTLNDLRKQAKEKGLPVHIVIDAGCTQIPSNSRTVLAIGPAPQQLVDQITGKLKLL